MSYNSILVPGQAKGQFLKGLSLCGLVLLSAPSWAQGFIDTTSGSINEKANGLDAEYYDPRSQAIINEFKRGRLSSAKDVNSRFSSYLEFHDSNQDGIIDHEVGSGNQGLEGKINSLLPTGKDLLERARKSREDANQRRCGDKNGTKTEIGKYSACFNPSGIILDDGAAHGGPKSSHRKYKLADEAKRAAEEAGEAMAERSIEDAQKAIQKQLGGDPKRKVAALDLLRSEAIWAEDQKENQYERNWKTLRAARLAGYDDVSDTIAGSAGFGIMHDVDAIISTASSKEEADQAIARRIAMDSVINSVELVDCGGRIVPEANCIGNQGKAIDGSNGNRITTLPDLYSSGNFSDQEIRQAQDAVREYVEKNKMKEKEVEDNVNKLISNNCMNADVWCHNANSALAANGNAQNIPKVAAFDVFQGDDPGDLFHDTRELNSINAQKAMNAPVTQMKKIIRSADLNEQTHPEVFKEIEEIERKTKELQESAEANGGKGIYDQNKQTLRQMTGITRGVNDTFQSQDVEVSNRGPVGGGLREPSGQSSSRSLNNSGYRDGNLRPQFSLE